MSVGVGVGAVEACALSLHHGGADDSARRSRAAQQPYPALSYPDPDAMFLLMAGATALLNRARPINRSEYERMVDAGLFEGERVELWKGVIVRMSSQKSPHASAVQRLSELFMTSLTPSRRASVRVQLPLALSDDSEPEPDIAVVERGDYHEAHPRGALLVVEVADSSLDDDRGFKADAYAAAGVPEYWVVDVKSRSIEVFTTIVTGRYSRRVVYSADATCCPEAFTDLKIAVRAVVG